MKPRLGNDSRLALSTRLRPGSMLFGYRTYVGCRTNLPAQSPKTIYSKHQQRFLQREKEENFVKQVDDRTRTNLEVALEETCRSLPHGGDHQLRKRIAQKLLHSAFKGNTTLGGLADVARAALAEATTKQRGHRT